MPSDVNSGQKLKPADEALLALLKNALFSRGDAAGVLNRDSDWVTVLRESVSQTVLPLAVEAMSILPEQVRPPESVMDPFVQASIRYVSGYEHLMAAQAQLLSALDEAAIPYAILKGSSVSRNYPKPELRVLGDIDVLVDRSDLDRAGDILKQAGYREKVEDHSQHLTFYSSKAVVELHYHVSTYPKNRAGEYIRDLMRSAVTDAIVCQVNQYSFRGLKNAHQAVSLLMHMQYHITGSGMGFRQLCDWAMYVHRLDGGAWQRDIEPVLKKCGLYRFAQIITATCSRYLGLPGDDCPWCLQVPETVCHALILDFFDSGNFGRKDSSRLSSSFLAGDQDRPGSGRISLRGAIRKLNRNALVHYPVVKKLPFLLPVMWVWGPIRHFVRNGKGQSVSDTLKGSLSSARKRAKLYSQFRLFEVDQGRDG